MKVKRWRSWRVCPACASRSTKMYNLNTGMYQCEVCDHEYSPPGTPSDLTGFGLKQTT